MMNQPSERAPGSLCRWEQNSLPNFSEYKAEIPVGRSFSVNPFSPNFRWEFVSSRKTAIAVMERSISRVRLHRVLTGSLQIRGASSDFSEESHTWFSATLVKRGCMVVVGSKGRVTFKCGPGEILMGPRRPNISANMIGPLEHFQLLVSADSIENVLPRSTRYSGLLKGSLRLGAVLTAYLDTLSNNFSMLDDQETEVAAQVAFDLLGATIAGTTIAECNSDNRSPQEALFNRLTEFIEYRLEDPNLTPVQIASANGMSLRYLHLLFSKKGHTVGGWIRERRLARCRADLMNPRKLSTLAEAAWRWGFYDAAHLGHAFKRWYGLSPGEFRRRMQQE